MEQHFWESDLTVEENTVKNLEKWALYKETAKTRQRKYICKTVFSTTVTLDDIYID